MAADSTGLRLLEAVRFPPERDLASELFHRINRILPDDQELLSIPPSTLVRVAVRLMRDRNYSQLPVVRRDGFVDGVFSYRSLAIGTGSSRLEEWTKERVAPGDLTVDEFLEQCEFARLTGELRRAMEAAERDGAVLVGTQERLLGILTPPDFVRYLYRVSGPFVLVSEIELALRALIRLALDPTRIALAARLSLRPLYKDREDKIPTELENMSFDNYKMLVCHCETWPSFQPLLGSTPTRVRAKFERIGEIRNVLFHFKREITYEDHEALGENRAWLLTKVQQAQILSREAAAR